MLTLKISLTIFFLAYFVMLLLHNEYLDSIAWAHCLLYMLANLFDDTLPDDDDFNGNDPNKTIPA